jgi:regulator of replication initiation timing
MGKVMKKLLLMIGISIYTFAQTTGGFSPTNSTNIEYIKYQKKIENIQKEIQKLKKDKSIDNIKIGDIERIILNNSNAISTHATILQNQELSSNNQIKRDVNTLRDTLVDTQFDVESISYDVRKLREEIAQLKVEIKELNRKLKLKPKVIIKEIKSKEQKLADIKMPKMKGGYFVLVVNRKDISIKDTPNPNSKVIRKLYRNQKVKLSECMMNGWCKLYKQQGYVARYLLREK